MPAEKSLAVLVREAEKSLAINAEEVGKTKRLGRFPTSQSALLAVAPARATLAEALAHVTPAEVVVR